MKKNAKSQSTLGSGLVILSSFFYASYGIWTTLIGKFLSGYTASAIRSVLVLMILLPIALFRHEFGPLNLKKNWSKIVGMIFVSTLIWGLVYYSVLNAGVGVSSTVWYAAITIGMVFFGWFLSGEKLTYKKTISIGIGILGLFFIFMQTFSGSISFLPLIAAVVSGLATAANNVIAKKLPYNTTQRTCVMWMTSVIANVPMIFILHEPIPQFGLQIEWIYLIIFAICSILASWTLLKGLEYIEAGLAGILGLMEIVFGILFGVLLFHESIKPLTLIGAIIILFASAFPYLYTKYHKK